MTKQVRTNNPSNEWYYFESPNPQINAVYNRVHSDFKRARGWALKHLTTLDWSQILEEGV